MRDLNNEWTGSTCQTGDTCSREQPSKAPATAPEPFKSERSFVQLDRRAATIQTVAARSNEEEVDGLAEIVKVLRIAHRDRDWDQVSEVIDMLIEPHYDPGYDTNYPG